MAYGYWKTGQAERPAVFHLFYRQQPFDGHYALCAGLELVVDYLRQLRFDHAEVQYLGGLRGADGERLFDEAFLNYLQRLEFRCDIDAIPEGTVVLPHEPLLRVKGPLLQAQLIETALLNLVNFSTLIATKAARVCRAAAGDAVLEFGLRRAQGIDGGLTASRSAYLGGCAATSNVLAGQLYGIPVRGTHAHSWVMAHHSELEAFRQYVRALPNNVILLVDTYDTETGILRAIEAAQALAGTGQRLLGIRLDSGDLLALSRKARELLDAAGLPDCKIVASNDLDEYRIAELKAAGAPIDIWGVGTRLVTAYEQAALGGVYKLAALGNTEGQWAYKIKRSEELIKTSNPGIQQVRRFYGAEGQVLGDVLYDELSCPDGELDDPGLASEPQATEDLLQPIFRAGQLVYDLPKISDIRQRAQAQLDQLEKSDLRLHYENRLLRIKTELIEAAHSPTER